MKKTVDSWITLIVVLSAHFLLRKGTLDIYHYMYTVYYSLRVYKLGSITVTFSPADPDLYGTDSPENVLNSNC